MKSIITALIIMAAVTIGNVNRADAMTGNEAYPILEDIIKISNDRNHQLQSAFDAGFILGSISSVRFLQKYVIGNSCEPTEVPNFQIAAITKKYMDKYPEDRHVDIGILIGNALQEAYPESCPLDRFKK